MPTRKSARTRPADVLYDAGGATGRRQRRAWCWGGRLFGAGHGAAPGSARTGFGEAADLDSTAREASVPGPTGPTFAWCPPAVRQRCRFAWTSPAFRCRRRWRGVGPGGARGRVTSRLSFVSVFPAVRRRAADPLRTTVCRSVLVSFKWLPISTYQIWAMAPPTGEQTGVRCRSAKPGAINVE